MNVNYIAARIMFCAPSTLRRRVRNVSAAVLLVVLALLPVGRAARADDDDEKKPAAPKAEGGKAEADKDKDEVRLTPEMIRRFGVRTGVAKKRKLADAVTAPARVTLSADATAVVGSVVQGRVVELKARVGDVVKERDELLVVESAELGEAQSDFLQKKTAVGGAAAAVEPAKSSAERAKALYDKSQGISLTELQKRETEYAAAQNALQTAKSALDAATNKLLLLGTNQTEIDVLTNSGRVNPRFAVRSPITGTVTERSVMLGELVKPDKDRLLVLADLSTLWVIADVPESRLREVKVGAKATVTASAVGDHPFEGKVAQVGISVDSATRSVPVRIEVKAEPSLRPGMFASVEIASAPVGENAGEPVLAVPESAVQTVEGSTAVFVPVKGEPNTFAARLISVGTPVSGFLPIISGLEDGERIVTAGSFILKADLAKASAKDDD